MIREDQDFRIAQYIILGYWFQIELFHDQLPLAVPCYDLLPVTEFTVGQHTLVFGYSRFP